MHTSIETDYTAPEITGHLTMEDEASCYTSAVDMWSLGCLVHFLLTGELPLSRRKLMLYCHEKIPFPRQHLEAHQSSELAHDFIHKLLQPHPRDRLDAADALKHEWPRDLAPDVTMEDAPDLPLQAAEDTKSSPRELDTSRTSRSHQSSSSSWSSPQNVVAAFDGKSNLPQVERLRRDPRASSIVDGFEKTDINRTPGNQLVIGYNTSATLSSSSSPKPEEPNPIFLQPYDITKTKKHPRTASHNPTGTPPGWQVPFPTQRIRQPDSRSSTDTGNSQTLDQEEDVLEDLTSEGSMSRKPDTRKRGEDLRNVFCINSEGIHFRVLKRKINQMLGKDAVCLDPISPQIVSLHQEINFLS